MKLKILVVFMLTFCFSGQTFAIYKCTNEKGKTSFQDKPCENLGEGFEQTKIETSKESPSFEDRASSQVKRHMLVELYQQMDISKIISSTEGHALMPAIRGVEGWGDSEYQCIMRDVHATLKDPIFEALLKQVPSELIAENVMFYQTEFGQRVNAVVIHGSGLSGLNIGEQTELKKNTAVLVFLSQLQKISQQTILDNMKPALGPAILACTPEP